MHLAVLGHFTVEELGDSHHRLVVTFGPLGGVHSNRVEVEFTFAWRDRTAVAAIPFAIPLAQAEVLQPGPHGASISLNDQHIRTIPITVNQGPRGSTHPPPTP